MNPDGDLVKNIGACCVSGGHSSRIDLVLERDALRSARLRTLRLVPYLRRQTDWTNGRW
jgi:hypothetical protein